MGTIATSPFLVEADRVAAAVAAIKTTFGTGSETGTISKGGANAYTAITALAAGGDSQITLALLPAAAILKDATKAGGYYYGAWYQYLLALHNHVGGLNDYLAVNHLRVHAHCRTVFSLIQPRYTFPEVTEFGDFTGGTWTESARIDTENWGDAEIEIELSAQSGNDDATLTVAGTDYDGGPVQATFTIPALSAVETVIQANESARRFAAISTVTIADSTANLVIRSKLDRTPGGLT